MFHRPYYDHVAELGPRVPSVWEMEQFLIELEQIAPVRVVVEIGVYQGDSLRYWRTFLNPELLIGIDPDPKLAGPDTGAYIITAPSQDTDTYDAVRAVLRDRPIDLLYIDGDHHYETIRSDWELYSPLVRSGGIIVLHDAQITWNDTVETYQIWPEIKPGHRTKLLWDGAGGTGLGIVYKP